MSFAESYVGKLRTEGRQRLCCCRPALLACSSMLRGASCWSGAAISASGRARRQCRSRRGYRTQHLRREMLEETGVERRTLTPYGFASDPATKTITFPTGIAASSSCCCSAPIGRRVRCRWPRRNHWNSAGSPWTTLPADFMPATRASTLLPISASRRSRHLPAGLNIAVDIVGPAF